VTTRLISLLQILIEDLLVSIVPKVAELSSFFSNIAETAATIWQQKLARTFPYCTDGRFFSAAHYI
jgi:hypothetical protein